MGREGIAQSAQQGTNCPNLCICFFKCYAVFAQPAVLQYSVAKPNGKWGLVRQRSVISLVPRLPGNEASLSYNDVSA